VRQLAATDADARAAIQVATELCQDERWPEGLSAARRAQAALAAFGADPALRQQADLEMARRLEGRGIHFA
jgi:hypothetical protein